MSGLFGFNNEDINKCNCPHCRGGHDHEINNEYDGQDDVWDFEGEEVDVEEVMYVGESINPEELIEEYVTYLLEDVEGEEDVYELMVEFFNHVSKYTAEQIYSSEIETKIQLLSILKNNQE